VAAEFIVIGLSHRTAPLAVRERLAIAQTDTEPVLQRLCALPSVGEALVVSTCNRVEVYAVAHARESALAEVRSFLGATRGVDAETLSNHLYERAGDQAVRHVFRVASALDSMVIGEPQILGQVKEAYGAAVRAGTAGALLTCCLERAFGVAKRVRTETHIAEGAASVSSVAVDLARSIFGELGGRIVLLVGAGKMAGLAARRLRAAGAAEVLVTNRTHERAVELAREVDGKARPWEDLEGLLGAADVAITSTGSPDPILDAPRMAAIVKRRKHRPLFLIDIAVPRDIDARVGELDNVFLYDVDDLERVVADNLRARQKEAEAAERIVADEVRQFAEWLRGQEVVPTIKDLRARADTIVEAELARTLPALDARWHSKVEAMARAIASKLLHAPLVAIKQDEELARSVRRLFDLDGAAAAPPAPRPADGQANEVSAVTRPQATPRSRPADGQANEVSAAPSGSPADAQMAAAGPGSKERP
jgi:glutamyl-tRNA reductase